jgi:hypothetical protein
VTVEALSEAVDGLELGLDGAELVATQRVLDRLSAKLVSDFDAAGLWDLDAATSMTAWLRQHAAMAGGDAAGALRLARRLRALPGTTAAALDGTLSGGQVKAIVANVSDRTVELFAGHEAELVPTLAALPVADVVVAMRTWAALAEDRLGGAEESEPASRLHLSTLLEGRWRLDRDLEALDGQTVATALRLASAADDEAEHPRSPGQRRADALVDICRSVLENRHHPPASRHGPMSTSSWPPRTWSRAEAGSAPTGWCSTGRRWPRWCATR